jgi:hypothetical protein
MSLEMAIGRELNAIERATPGLSTYAKQVAALDAAIDRLDARRRNSKGVSRGRKQDWPLLFMFDQLVDVTHHLDPSITEPRDRERKRLRKFIRAFMVAMGMKPQRRLRADRLLPERRKVLLKTEQAKVDAARWREIDKQNDQTIELLSKLGGPMQPPHWSRSQLITWPRLPPRSGH